MSDDLDKPFKTLVRDTDGKLKEESKLSPEKRASRAKEAKEKRDKKAKDAKDRATRKLWFGTHGPLGVYEPKKRDKKKERIGDNK